jgi:hypothetical protein
MTKKHQGMSVFAPNNTSAILHSTYMSKINTDNTSIALRAAKKYK